MYTHTHKFYDRLFVQSNTNMHSITALTSFIFALIAYADTNHALFGFCWMNLSATPTMSSRQHSRSGIFFAVQIIIVYFFSLAAMVRSWKRLEKGLPDTFRTRTRMLRHLKYYVGIFFVYWTVVFVLYSVYKFLPGIVDSSRLIPFF